MGIKIQYGKTEPKPVAETRLPTPEETKLTPMNRAERERLPEKMAAELMDYFMGTLNDMATLNPIRDGIPQCTKHPFKPPRQVGCIHSCAKHDPNAVLPVVKDYTLGDVYNWVKALVLQGVHSAERNKKWHRPVELR